MCKYGSYAQTDRQWTLLTSTKCSSKPPRQLGDASKRPRLTVRAGQQVMPRQDRLCD